ncbi:Uncharacterized protein HZ326_20119 [Fusarium oxysporum f. sp. albedinis]|nr:Uncharacterized protein HZ326_20119 [Fusarium oxysporum f. sp. albedinis]
MLMTVKVGSTGVAWGKMTGCHSLVPLWSVLKNIDLFHTLAATSFCSVTFRLMPQTVGCAEDPLVRSLLCITATRPYARELTRARNWGLIYLTYGYHVPVDLGCKWEMWDLRPNFSSSFFLPLG